MFITPAPKPAEWLHTKKCFAEAMISAIQNAKDDEGYSHLDFAIWTNDGGPFIEAHRYLDEGLQTCICPEGYVGG